MDRPPLRFLSVLIALALGVGVVVLLVFLGDRSQGPIGDALSSAGNTVQRIENSVMLEDRGTKRADHLAWYHRSWSSADDLKGPGPMLVGAFDNTAVTSFGPVVDLEDSLHTVFPLIHIYTAWGSKPEEQFPTERVEAVFALGSTPVITWEPWLSDISKEEIPGLRAPEQRDKGGMADVARGAYDRYLVAWAKAAAAVGRPFFLRLGHEMNDPYRYPWGPQNNSAREFVAAWRHVHDIFRQNNAGQVLWIWCPHPAYGYFKDYYPGDAYVDYVGAGTLNYGNVAAWSAWWSFKDIFGKHYAELAAFGKPIMLTEFGSLGTGGDRAEWYTDALARLPEDYPAVRAILFFHFGDDRTTTQQALDWTVKSDPPVLRAIRTQLEKWQLTDRAAHRTTNGGHLLSYRPHRPL